MKSGLTAEDITAAKKPQGDCARYLAYTDVYGDNGYDEPYTVTNTVQIKVKLK